MTIYLSHPITSRMPVYGEVARQVEIQARKAIINGDQCNTYSFKLENHWGTHIDCPNHFFPDGKKIVDYPADLFIFHNPQIITIQLCPNELVTSSHLTNLNKDTDLLLIRSGWSDLRDKECYCFENPGLTPELGEFLRRNYPTIRALGIDWISASPYQNKQIGRDAHRAFLDPQGHGQPILIIEDMLIPKTVDLKMVVLAPLRLEGIDSAPCTVLGVLERDK